MRNWSSASWMNSSETGIHAVNKVKIIKFWAQHLLVVGWCEIQWWNNWQPVSLKDFSSLWLAWRDSSAGNHVGTCKIKCTLNTKLKTCLHKHIYVDVIFPSQKAHAWGALYHYTNMPETYRHISLSSSLQVWVCVVCVQGRSTRGG